MPHCKKAQTPCTCGRLVLYDRNGRLVEQAGHSRCPSDSEANNALTAMLQDWRSRAGDRRADSGHAIAGQY